MEAELEVLQPGLYSSIQDEGRFGFRKYGVPQSGAMDQLAAGMANLLLQNEQSAAVMEITLQGPVLKFSEPTQIAITGANLSPVLNDLKLLNNQAYHIEAGQLLRFGGRISGFRTYVAIKNGFQTANILRSRSWCKGITPHHRLEKGMVLPYFGSRVSGSEKLSAVKSNDYLASGIIEAFPGPEFHRLSESEKEKLQYLHVSVGRNSDRMGIQFQEQLKNSLEPIITGPVLPGTVQLTPSGTLIVLMRDCQTTGGYPRILQLSAAGMNVLAQKLPGEKLQMKIINYNDFG